jgi:hypothetical protein
MGALATYTLLTVNLFTYKQEMLALCLLFSGGTFLYVATAHVLPEIQAGSAGGGHGHGALDADGFADGAGGGGAGSSHSDDDGAGYGEGGHGHSHGHKTPPKMKWREVWVMVTGVLLPLLIDVHHGH